MCVHSSKAIASEKHSKQPVGWMLAHGFVVYFRQQFFRALQRLAVAL